MPPAAETRRPHWLLLGGGWALAAVLIGLHTAVVADYLALLDRAGRHGGDAAPTPLRQIVPARYADAQMWVRHAIAGSEAGVVRVRRTTVDNAPEGREVHWSSGFLGLLRGAGALQRGWSGAAPATAIERVLPWFNAPLLFAAIVGLSAWTARRLGAAAGVLVAGGMVGHPRFYEGFTPAYVDHHGLVNAALLGLVLGATGMGFGWWRAGPAPAAGLLPVGRGPARRAAVLSALGGALALWHSAAAALPAIALVGAAGLVAARWLPPPPAADGPRFDPELWRLWGRTGALASLACYFLEYAPGHLGWRLEVNHPLHALAWWGGAGLVALLGRGREGGAPAPRAGVRAFLPPLLALAAAPAAIGLGGGATFWLGDAFVGELRHFVIESRSLPATWREYGADAIAGDLLSTLLLIPAILLLLRRRADAGRPVLGALTLVTAALVLMACGVVRWWNVASAAQIALLACLFVAAGESLRRRRLLALTATGVLIVAPAVWQIARDHRANRQGQVAAIDLYQPLYRDLAGTLRASDPDGRITVLASPNASAGIAYFGRFQSVGTLFWENAPGLRAAAAIFAAEDDAEARRLLAARNVTHVVMLSAASFVGEYFQLLHPTRPREDAQRTFGFRLAGGPAQAPRWLQAIPFRRTALLAGIGGDVWVFQVVPDLPEERRLFQAAAALAAAGNAAAAEQAFLGALALVPPKAQASFCGFAGETAYEQGVPALAVKLLRRSLALAPDPDVANLAAWILATSSEPGVRDGVQALALVAPLARRAPDDPLVASTLAAAYAEVGRFDEAVAAAEKALALVRRGGGDAGTDSLLARRLASYREKRPWRQ